MKWELRVQGECVQVLGELDEGGFRPLICQLVYNDANGCRVTNGQMIVRAVNSHDELLAACKAALQGNKDCFLMFGRATESQHEANGLMQSAIANAK